MAETGRPATVVTDEAVDLAVDLLARQWHKSQIKQALRAKWPGDARSYEEVLSRARKRMATNTAKPYGIHVDDALELLNAVIRDPKSSHFERLKAQEHKNKILGIGSQYGHRDDDSSDPITADQVGRALAAAKTALFDVVDAPDAAGDAGESGPVQGGASRPAKREDGVGETDAG